MNRIIGIMVIVATVLLLGQLALAEGQGGGKGRGKGEGRGKGGHRKPPVVFGTLQSVSGDTWTLKPQLAPKMQEHREQKGKDMPQLPEKVTVTIGSATKFYLNGEASSASAFKVGDQVVIKLQKPQSEGGNPTAQIVADPETAREFIMEKMREHGGKGKGKGGGGKGGHRGDGGPGGPGGEGQRGPRLIFGTVTAASSTSITVTPEVPSFISELLPGKGEKMQGKLPASISVALGGETKFVVNKQEQSSNPFKKGDKVAILPEGGPDNATARIVSDYASAKAKMQQRMEKRQDKREGKGKGQG